MRFIFPIKKILVDILNCVLINAIIIIIGRPSQNAIINWLWPASSTTLSGGKAAGSRWHELWVQQPQSTTTKLVSYSQFLYLPPPNFSSLPDHLYLWRLTQARYRSDSLILVGVNFSSSIIDLISHRLVQIVVLKLCWFCVLTVCLARWKIG